MKISHGLTFAAASTSLLLAVTALTPSPGKADRKTDDALKVADALDAIVQPRFQKDEGRFGVGRIVTINWHTTVIGHDLRDSGTPIDTTNAKEAVLLDMADSYGRDYFVSFLRMAHAPGKGKGPAEVFETGTTIVRPSLILLSAKDGKTLGNPVHGYYTEARPVEQAVLSHLPKLRKGDKAQATSGKWLVVMRPVRALQASCLSCHTSAKLGDTLGVMVYAVDKTDRGAKR